MLLTLLFICINLHLFCLSAFKLPLLSIQNFKSNRVFNQKLSDNDNIPSNNKLKVLLDEAVRLRKEADALSLNQDNNKLPVSIQGSEFISLRNSTEKETNFSNNTVFTRNTESNLNIESIITSRNQVDIQKQSLKNLFAPFVSAQTTVSTETNNKNVDVNKLKKLFPKTSTLYEKFPWWIRWVAKDYCELILNAHEFKSTDDVDIKFIFEYAAVYQFYEKIESVFENLNDDAEVSSLADQFNDTNFVTISQKTLNEMNAIIKNLADAQVKLGDNSFIGIEVIVENDAWGIRKMNDTTTSTSTEATGQILELIHNAENYKIRSEETRRSILESKNSDFYNISDLLLEGEQIMTSLLSQFNNSLTADPKMRMNNQGDSIENALTAANDKFSFDTLFQSQNNFNTDTTGIKSNSSKVSKNSWFDIKSSINDALNGQIDDEDNSRSLAERLIFEYFDFDSRTAGAVVSRQGAALFQKEVLNDIFSVSEVKSSQGAFIFEGKPTPRSKSNLSQRIEEYFQNSGIKEYVDYILILNEKYINLDDGITQIAWDAMSANNPAIIVYPKSWNSAVVVSGSNSFRRWWKTFFSSCAMFTTGLYAADALNLLNVDSESISEQTNIPTDLIYLSLGSFIIPTLTFITEYIIASAKGVKISGSLLPTLSMFNYSVRTAWLTMPKSRNDIFDITFAGVIVGLLSSIIALYWGISLTLSSTSEQIISTFPAIPISLLQTNSILSEILSTSFSNTRELLLATPTTSVLHVHWLAIVGATSLIANTLQLIPVDNSSGAKLNFAVLGIGNNTAFNAFVGLFKAIFFFVSIFTLNAGDVPDKMITKSRLLLDYLLSSQIAGTALDSQIAKDNLTELSEGRKIIYYGFVSLLAVSFLPLLTLSAKYTNIIDNGINYLKAFGGVALFTDNSITF